MGANRVRETLDFENTLKQGDECIARWTNSGYCHKGTVRVLRVNEKSIRVELLEEVRTPLDPKHGYPKGQELVLPRFWDFRRWSENNRLVPTPVNVGEGG